MFAADFQHASYIASLLTERAAQGPTNSTSLLWTRLARHSTLSQLTQLFMPNCAHTLRRMLMEEVEGTCLGNAGFVISVYATKDDSITMGIIEFDTGFANVSVAYSAVCFRTPSGARAYVSYYVTTVAATQQTVSKRSAGCNCQQRYRAGLLCRVKRSSTGAAALISHKSRSGPSV
eukprot:8228-Heterococcus_DN1.PRE.8